MPKIQSTIGVLDKLLMWMMTRIQLKYILKIVRKNAQKVAPFRRHTQGYTGQKKNAFRDFKMSIPEHKVVSSELCDKIQMQQKVQDTIRDEFKNLETPFKVTQFIRGELYFYVDSLISMINQTSQDDLSVIFDFMQDVFKLIFKWMEIFPQYLISYQEALHHPQLYLVSLDAAIAMCGNELFGILEKCFGGCIRCIKFFQKYSSEIIQTEGPNNFFAKERIKNNGMMASFLNAFGNMNGFERVLNFISFDIKDPKAPTSSKSANMIKGCPYTLSMKILRALFYVFENLENNFSMKFAEDVCSALIYRLDNLSDNEIKELDKDILHGIIEILKEYMSIIQPKEADKQAELRELQIAHKYLRCPFFEKRVRGINELKEIYQKVNNSSIKSRNNEQYQYTKWLDFEKYSQWLIDQKIIEFIFIENPHVELIKRSGEIMRLLARDEKYFQQETVEMLWICASEKHEDIVRATLDLIQELALMMPLERVAFLSLKLKNIKENEFDEKMVNFLKQFTLNVMKNIRNIKALEQKSAGSIVGNIMGKKKESKIDEGKYIDLNLLWSIFQDQNKVSQKIKDLALNSLIEILQDFNDKDSKEYYYTQAIENIKKSQTFYSSIVFLKKLINTYPLDSQIKFKPTSSVVTVQMVLKEIFKQYELFEIILNNLKIYLAVANEAKMKLETIPDKLQSICLASFATHEDFINEIMSFIQFVIVNSKVTLTYEIIEKMFQLMVTKAVTEHESNQLFNLITKENESAKSKERRFLLDDKVRNMVFQKIFCNNKYINFDKMNIRGFNCFKKLFLIVNEEEKNVEIWKEDRIYVNNTRCDQLQGIDSLWSIACYSDIQEVKEISRDFLVDLYLNVKVKSSAQKKQINESFQSQCFEFIRRQGDKPNLQLNCLRLLRTFINRFDGEHIYEEDMSNYPLQELRPIEVTLNPDKINIIVKVHPNQKLWQLKRKMANTFKMKLSEFYIKTKQGPLQDSIYDEQLNEYKIEKIHISRISTEEMEREFPRYLIGYNSDYLRLFLDLLKTGKEECKREVLNLLEILPINLDVKVYMRETIYGKGTEKQTVDWNQLFQYNKQELASCCYYLMAVEDLIIPRKDSPSQEINQVEAQTKQEFTLKLLANGGFKFLYDLFEQIDKTKQEREIIKTKILTLLLKLFSYFFNLKQTSVFKQSLTPPLIETLIYQTLSTVENYINGVYNQQTQGIPAGEERNIRLLKREPQILSNSLNFMNRAFQFNHTLVETLYKYNGIQNIFRMALIDLEIKQITDQTFTMIQDISIKLDISQQINVKPSYFFLNMFITDFLSYSLKVQKSEKTFAFFLLLNEVFMKTEVFQDLNKIKPVGLLANEISEMIIKREIKEISARDEDIQLQGLFSFLKNLFIKFPMVRDNFATKNQLLQYLIHNCLFHKETRGQMISKEKPMPPKCKNISTREKCLELINEVCVNNVEGIYILIRYLKNHLSETFWRTPRKSDWTITVHQQERSQTGFVGLKNIGCICYMNSIMQQLFMIPTFRKAILEVEDSNFGKESNDENVLHQLKMIFGGLMEIERQYFNPKKFCNAFKDIDGSPIDPMVQKDVDEFFNMAIDRVENLVKGKKEEKVIKNLYQGVFANEFICKGCPHYSEREETFMTINLQVKNKHSIKESLEAFVEGEMLEGDNAYYCEKCEKKVNTLKRCCIKRMPNVLFMVLKRFEFNFDTMSKFKINDYCEFPMQINMKEYCQQSLAKQDLIKMMEDKNMTLEDLSEEQRAILDRDLPSKYYDYNLRGTVIHIGTAEQGHYISYIQDRENLPNKWYEFNDHIVKEFNQDDIPYEAFGGEDESFVNNLNIQQMQGSGLSEQMINQMKQLKTKIKNAYILIYERDEAIDMEKFNEFMDDPNINTNKADILQRYDNCKLPKTTSAQIQIPPTIHDFILEKNKKFWLSKFIFNNTYIQSVLNIFNQIPIQENNEYQLAREANLQEYSGTQFEMFKFLATFFLTTVIRAKERGKTVPFLMQIIRQALQKNVMLSVWLLESFNNQDLIREFLIDCPITDMKRFVAGLINTAMQTVYKYEEAQIQQYCANMDSGSVEYVLQTQQNYLKQHRVFDNKSSTSKGNDSLNSGPCQKLNVITLSHHSEKLPVLILMINSFIHMNVSQHYFRMQGLTCQFYQVFAYFSDLGEQARHYLLKCKTVGRMLDLFFNPEMQGSKVSPQISEKFRIASLEHIPFFQLNKELYMQSNLEKSDVKVSIAERKVALYESVPHQMFLLYTVSKLSRSCIFVKEAGVNPLANDNLKYNLDDDEVSMIINFESPLIWSLCDRKVTRNAVADMYAHMSFANKQFSLRIIQTILNGMQKASFEEMKNYERALIKMLMINDEYIGDRTKTALNLLTDNMKVNTTFYKEMDSYFDILYKIVQRCQAAVDMLNKSQAFITFIERWSKENPHLPLNQQKCRVFKAGVVSWNSKPNLINQQTIDKVAQYQKERLQRILSYIQKETPVNDKAYDSDDDMYHHTFTVKERVDFMDQNLNMFTGTVEFALNEMVKCVSEITQVNQKPNITWIGTELDQISPLNQMIGSEKKRMLGFYLSLYRTIQN